VPRDATTRGLDPGERAEVRVAQAWFWDGYYVRRGVDLQHRFGSEVATVTDLDLIGYAFDQSCGFRKQIGEVKSGKAASTPKPLDRALWMRGLRELVGAHSCEVTTAFNTSGAARDACRRLGATVQHLDELTTREKRLNVQAVDDVGSQGETVALMRRKIAKYVKTDPFLERAWWFLVSEVWFLEPFDALKRTLGVIRELGKSWPPEAHTEATEAARWFFAEAISVATLQLAVLAGEANTMDGRSFRASAVSRLATGDLPYHGVKKLAERVDVFVGKVLSGLNAPPEVVTSTIGAFAPVPPDYTEPLLELISRLAADAAATAALPRQMDTVVFERLVHRRVVNEKVLARLNCTHGTERLVRLVAAFLGGQFALPEPVKKVLTTALFNAPGPPSSASTSGTVGPPLTTSAQRADEPDAVGPKETATPGSPAAADGGDAPGQATIGPSGGAASAGEPEKGSTVESVEATEQAEATPTSASSAAADNQLLFHGDGGGGGGDNQTTA
jgi:hypothetical protein